MKRLRKLCFLFASDYSFCIEVFYRSKTVLTYCLYTKEKKIGILFLRICNQADSNKNGLTLLVQPNWRTFFPTLNLDKVKVTKLYGIHQPMKSIAQLNQKWRQNYKAVRARPRLSFPQLVSDSLQLFWRKNLGKYADAASILLAIDGLLHLVGQVSSRKNCTCKIQSTAPLILKHLKFPIVLQQRELKSFALDTESTGYKKPRPFYPLNEKIQFTKSLFKV